MTPDNLRLSILDFCLMNPGAVDYNASLWECIDSAIEAERHGYSRYWLTEHHVPDHAPTIAQSTPEILLPILAGVTEHLRVGTAGVLLSYQYPGRLAKAFQVLSALFPDRIDLGLARGRAPELDRWHETQPYLGTPDRAFSAEHYEARVTEVMKNIMTGYENGPVAGANCPEVWIMGSQRVSATIAAEKGLAFCLNLFLEGSSIDKPWLITEAYAQAFRPSTLLERPTYAVAIAGTCAPTAKEAETRVTGWRQSHVRPLVVGDPSRCRALLDELARQHATREIVILDVTPHPERRRASYALLAEACGLRQPDS